MKQLSSYAQVKKGGLAGSVWAPFKKYGYRTKLRLLSTLYDIISVTKLENEQANERKEILLPYARLNLKFEIPSDIIFCNYKIMNIRDILIFFFFFSIYVSILF
jgi:hypothetical protein